MSDWLYEATNAQARLEHANSRIAELEEEVAKYKDVLHTIAKDPIELSHDKVRWQRDHYKNISRKVLGYVNVINQQGVSNAEIDNDF